ncbi:MAG: hypothetical protein GXY44_02610 [Phycisphaerales bacterium]|nr:hypothetical protein [Phycisphaerales bacterium]
MYPKIKFTFVAISAIFPCSAGLAYEYVYDASDYATEVVEYVQGGAVPFDWIWHTPFNLPEAALGRPTIDTTGDWMAGSPEEPITVAPVYPAFRVWELVSIGEGGHLILKFDRAVTNDPRNPCGIDFIVYGNTFQMIDGSSYWQNGDPNQCVIGTSNVWAEPGTVSVAQTYDPEHPELTTWYMFTDGPNADMFAPTLGRIYDPDAPSELPHNGWWGAPTNPLIPFNPALSPASFQGHSLAYYTRKYGYSAGGTGFDLDDVGIEWFQYIRIQNPTDSGMTPEIDAVAIVDPEAAAPDFDCDTDVDADDLVFFRSCVTGPGIRQTNPACARADLDKDGDVDQDDFAILQRCFSGADIPADPACMGQ